MSVIQNFVLFIKGKQSFKKNQCYFYNFININKLASSKHQDNFLIVHRLRLGVIQGH